MFKTNPEARPVEMFPGVVRRTLNSGEKTTMVELHIAAGATVPAHNHPHEQIGYVSTGRVRFRIGEETKYLGPGDSYMVPGGETHEVTAIEASVCIDVFSPVRTEYLD